MNANDKRYVLLDRDGIINRRMPGVYVVSWDQFHFLPRALDALRLLAQNGFVALIVSNQACVGEGLLSSNDLDAITSRFLLEVALSGGNIAQVYYCRHSAENQCNCRNPRTGLIRRAQVEHRFAPETTFLVGDCPGDLRAAEEFGCPAILIRRESFLEVRCPQEGLPTLACNLYEAAELILEARHTPRHEAEAAMVMH